MKLLLLFFCLLAPSAHALPLPTGSFVTIDGRRVYTLYKPAQKGEPTVVLLNGLTYSTRQWNAFASALERLNPKAGLLRYDMIGMGETLLAGPLPVNYSISLDSQVELLQKLFRKLGLEKADLLGLSYGGGVALAFAKAHPQSVHSLILMAPFTEALADQDRLIRAEVQANRLAFPMNPATDDELYDFFLRQFIYQTYPSSEPVVLENPFKLEAIFRMVQGIRLFRAEEISKDIHAPVHLMLANQDQYIPKDVLNRFWSSLPRSVRASRIDISFTEHKIPEAIPNFAAAWVSQVIEGKIAGECSGDTLSFSATCGKKTIRLPGPFETR